MLHRPLAFVGLLVVGLAVAAVTLRPAPPSVEPSSRGTEPPEAAKFHAAYQAALARRLDWNYLDLTLDEIARDLETRLQLPVVIDRERIAALPWEKKLTLVANNLSVRTGLDFLLQPTLLTFVPYEGKLLITNQDFVTGDEPKVVRHYSVPDLRQPFVDAAGKWHVGIDPLRVLIHRFAEVENSVLVSGPDENTLALRQTLDGHERVESLLDGLRRVKREHAADPRVVRTPFIDLQPPDPTLDIHARRADIAFEGSLEDWGRAVEKSYGLYVHLFPPVLIDPSVIEPRVLKGNLKQARLDEMLNHFLKPHRLQYRLRTERSSSSCRSAIRATTCGCERFPCGTWRRRWRRTRGVSNWRGWKARCANASKRRRGISRAARDRSTSGSSRRR